jgi:hypothetical protein
MKAFIMNRFKSVECITLFLQGIGYNTKSEFNTPIQKQDTL